MSEIFYTVIIFPVEKIIELFYLFIWRIFENPVVAITGVSFAISILTLPLYNIAEKTQCIERETRKSLTGKIAKIKKVFHGDEQYMILSTFYRQNHYHPVYALRSSASLLIQIPFFIAAYLFLSNPAYEVLNGASFLFIQDLSQSDKLIPGGFNLLPFLMTLINCVSCAVYTKGFPSRDKIQLYGIAFVFLLLLYNSPSGLVIYWTVNNIFSLIKAVLRKTKHSKKIIYYAACVSSIMLILFLIFFHSGSPLKRAIVGAAASVVFILPLLKKGATVLFRHVAGKTGITQKYEAQENQSKIFLLAALSLFIITGFVIPGAVISSSVPEFSFIENSSSPLPFIVTTVLQSAGIFLFWPILLYLMSPKKVKHFFNIVFCFLLTGTLINVFLFSGFYGVLTNTLLLSEPGTWQSNFYPGLVNIGIFIILALLLAFLFSSSKTKKIILPLEITAFISLLCLGTINIFRINTDYKEFAKCQIENTKTDELASVYSLSSEDDDVVVIILDKAISGYVPEIFREKPELNKTWSGFTFYPNSAGFSSGTLIGMPSLCGGYSYTPLNMNKNQEKPLVEKHNEALLLMPRIFTENAEGKEYTAIVTDPSYANYGWLPDISIFDPYPNINAKNIGSAYIDLWLGDHPDLNIISISDLLKERLIRFSFFKCSPVILRTFIYDRGDWLTVNNKDKKRARKELTVKMIGNYAALDYLPALTTVNSNKKGNFLMIFNEMTHEPSFLQCPGYIPAANVTDKGNGVFSGNALYHINMAAFLLLGKWFDYLKENNAYDNTRIIVVSDHGDNAAHPVYPGSFILPNGTPLETYTTLLMVKDFRKSGDLVIDDSFMTHADVPLLAFDGIINNPVNPFTGLPVINDKSGGVMPAAACGTVNPATQGKYSFNLGKDEWLFVHDNIFDPGNWEKGKVE